MKVIRLFFFCALVLSVSAACDQPTIDEEVDDVCECLKAAKSEADWKKCQTKMQQISDKYAFDPEASGDIKKRLSECAPK